MFNTFLNTLKSFDFYEYAESLKPKDYKIKILFLTNVSFFTYILKDRPINYVCCSEMKGKFHYKNKSILSFSRFKDNLCFFRCLAGKEKLLENVSCISSVKSNVLLRNVETSVKNLYRRFKNYFSNSDVTLNLIPELESLFNMKINIYTVDSSGNVNLIYLSDFMPIPLVREMNLDLVTCDKHNQSHFSLIIEWDLYLHNWVCNNCNHSANDKSNFTKHRLTQCFTKPLQTNRYCKGFYNSKTTLTEQLDLVLDIQLKEPLHYPFFIVFDFESMLIKTSLDMNTTRKSTTINEHSPISVSVFSNVPSYDKHPICIIRSTSVHLLIKDFILCLKQIQDKAFSIIYPKYKYIFNLIIDRYKEDKYCSKKTHVRFVKRLQDYLNQIPVLSFNGGKYDINLIKEYFFDQFSTDLKDISTIKKGNNYMAIFTPSFKFLDIVNYLAAGTSYKNFLELFQCSESKPPFPYDYLTSLDVLNETSLPSQESFFNSLTNQSISDNDYAESMRLWTVNNMKTFRDYLIFYNNNDTIGFVVAVSKLLKIYDKENICLFKETISLPGVSMLKLFRSTDKALFTLCNNAGIHSIIQSGIQGGISLIFCRYVEVGVTKIKSHIFKNDEALPCSIIKGFDANALYLYATSLDMPTFIPIHYSICNITHNLVPSKYGNLKYSREVCWLLLLEIEYSILIRSCYRDGQKSFFHEGKIYYLDGYYFDKSKNTKYIFEYFGCFWHRCITCGFSSDNNQYNETIKRVRLFEKLGYKVIYIWDHEFKFFLNENMKKSNIKRLDVLTNLIPFNALKLKHLTQKEVLKNIENKNIFGLVKCTIRVNDKFRSIYDEFPPLFKKAKISYEQLSPEMKTYIKNNNLNREDKTLLISGMEAVSQVFITPMICWYLKMNKFHEDECFSISCIEEVIQYKPYPCFKKHTVAITRDRIRGDSNKKFAINACISKTEGNCLYGRTLQNMTTHKKIVYADEDNVHKYLKSPLLSDINTLGNVFEISLNKSVINWNQPMQIGVFVYGYSKIHMLKFVYEFIVIFFLPTHYEFIQTDTDSLYIAFHKIELIDNVKPNLKHLFELHKKKWLVSEQANSIEKRIPGKFKLEFTGKGFFGPDSKTYFCVGDKDNNKIGQKGIGKSNKLTLETFKQLMYGDQSTLPTFPQKRFQVDKEKGISTIQTDSIGLKNLYYKRFVLTDGIHTTTMNTDVFK